MGKTADENDEFEKQRTAAIAEVAKTKEVGNSLPWVCVFITSYGNCSGNWRILNYSTQLLQHFETHIC